MAKSELIPADLYVQAPRTLKLKAKSDFAVFVRQFPPEYFMAADVPMITYFLEALRRFEEVSRQLGTIDSLVTENDLGTESVHPLWKVRNDLIREINTWSAYLRVAPPLRTSTLAPLLPSQKPAVRLLYNFTNEKPVYEVPLEQQSEAS